MKWRGHLAVYIIAALIYLAWLLPNAPSVLSMSGIVQVIVFAVAGLLGTYNGLVRISPDIDTYPIIRHIVAHRSIFFHSPLVPYILLNFVEIENPAYTILLGGDLLAALIFGFVFGWCVHIFADALTISGIRWWDIPGSDTSATVRILAGLTCVAATIFFFVSYFIGWAAVQTRLL
jgi:membrane-bound metal-dependent hydrolase YbcI (DUF457 family)